MDHRGAPMPAFERPAVLTDAAPWLQDALQSLSRLAALPPNWDSYGADPPNATAIALARIVLSAMSDIELKPSHLDASAESGVCLSFVQGSRYADIECFNSGEVLAVTSAGDGHPTVWEVPVTDVEIASAVAVIQTYLQG